MNRKGLFAAISWAGVAGAAVAVLTGDEQAVSLRIWLAVSAVWFTVMAVRELHQVVPLVPSRFRALFGRRAKEPAGASQLRQLRNLDSLVMRSRENSRAFEQQLRPRLIELGDHYLALNHSVDTEVEPERAQDVLGAVGWLVDPTQANREPTLEELEHFMSILTGTKAANLARPTPATSENS